MTAGWEVLNEDVPILTHPHCFTLHRIQASLILSSLNRGLELRSKPLTLDRVHASMTLSSLNRGLFPLIVVEDGLTHTHRLRGDLDEFVLFDILQTLLQRHDRLWDNTGLIVGT